MFRWNTKIHKTTVTLDVHKLHIEDIFGKFHFKSLRKPDVYWESPKWKPSIYEINVPLFLKDKTILEMDEGNFIPMCNVKNITVETNKIEEEVSYHEIGMKEWDVFDWCGYLFLVGLVLVAILVFTLAIISKIG